MKTIVIAGATGGIGQALVREIFQRWPEAKVGAIGRNREKLDRLAETVSEDAHLVTRVLGIDDFRREETVQWIADEFPAIDLAIYAQGILNVRGQRPEKSLREIDSSHFLEAMRVNALAPLDFAWLLKSSLRASPGSRLMALSAKVGSIGDNGTGGWHSYRMSKAALNMGLRNVALEFQKSSIVCAVHPGTTLTDFSRDYVSRWAEGKVSDADTTAQRLLDLSLKLEPAQSGTFMHWDGTPLPW